MADTKTADQWKIVADTAQVRLAEVTQEKIKGEQQLVELNQQLAEQNKKISDFYANNPGFVPNNGELRALEAQKTALEQEITRTSVYVRSTLTSEQLKLRGEITRANNQEEIAADSPYGTRANPVTHANTPPVDDAAIETSAPAYKDENAIPDEPIEAQQQVAYNTSGLPVLAEDGSVALGVAINPETGETFLTDLPADETKENIPYSVEVTASRIKDARDSDAVPRYEPFKPAPDYRVKISLAPSATYLYKDPEIINSVTNILYPLSRTNGVIFPYTPQISVAYSANYAATDLTHSNYKIYNYAGSSIDSIQITGNFTAQDVNEANYVLAVIHFFRSVTKMFYGQDENPIAGVPPPLVYLSGHGEYGFDNHPMAITNFNLSYPDDVDYINAGPNYNGNITFTPYKQPVNIANPSFFRLRSSKLQPGGMNMPPIFSVQNNGMAGITRVPTRMQIQLNAIPIVTRYNIANNFSLKDYASGKLLRGSKNSQGGGIW